VKSNVLPMMQPGDWMVGGSRDAEGERLYGFGPQQVAQIAAEVYAEAVQWPHAGKAEFCRAFVVGFASQLSYVVGVPVPLGVGDA
jgi:hypothetical protein